MDGQRIARIVLPLVVVLVLGDRLASQPWAPPWLDGLVTVIFAGGLVVALVLAFRESAWGRLAERYPVRDRYAGPWTVVPTLHVSNLTAADAGYQRDKARFVGLVRLGATERDLFLSCRLAPFGVLMPPIQIPRAAITNVNHYDHDGTVSTAGDSRAIVQLTYDPHFSGRIAEIAIGTPPIHLQLSAALFEAIVTAASGAAPARAPRPATQDVRWSSRRSTRS